ncbi:SDR family NAD(P)-dependent oxidoreductase [Robiginitalea sp. IMCC43444]|uniref:SDR family NAD(P)-dependent oxidoreductase n=1 Tax=Robiginitalea sp. IMCC43444 TaxID=3459121 RepID=UPI004042843D
MAKIVVTGCSRGIGYELVRLLLNDGHEVLALSRNTDPLQKLQHKKLSFRSFDITRDADIQAVASWLSKEWKAVDVLVNNAGTLLNKPFADTSFEDFEEVYAVNVFGLAALTRALIPLMSSEGHVVSISSMGGVQGSAKFPGLAAYSSSKGALITLSELLAEEYKDKGPAFNVLALGAVQTEMLEAAFPGYKAPISAAEMAAYIMDFALNGQRFYNGKVLQVSSSTP